MVYTETTRQGKQQPRQLESKIKKKYIHKIGKNKSKFLNRNIIVFILFFIRKNL